jgi:N-acetylglucosamine-6-sulfatase
MDASRMAVGDGWHRTELECLQSVDRAIGDIVNALSSTGRLNNTIFVFTSDNGLSWGEHRILEDKFSPYEESIRVPFLVRVPGATARADDSLVMSIDLAPTIAEWAGVAVPSKVNGQSFANLVRDPASAWRTEGLVELMVPGGAYNTPAYSGVRTKRYVYVEYATNEKELYDLQSDPYQMVNQINNPGYAATITMLQGLLNALKGS